MEKESPNGPKPNSAWFAKKLAHWQDRLGLGGWLIGHKIVRGKKIYDEERKITTLGRVTHHYPSAQAVIEFMRPDDLEVEDWIFNYSAKYETIYEVALVHELLHLLFVPIVDLDWSEGMKADEERIVETVARVLVLGRVGN